jgi:endonuclease III
VNEVTKPLFAKYRRAQDWLRVPDRVLERELKPTGFFRMKTKAVKGACQGLVERFGGEVPRTLDELVTLRGVGRKTASIVLGGAFGVPSIAVDRHVARVALRLGLARSSDPDLIEEQLRVRLPKAQWVKATWCLVLHGRRICRPVPECPRCPVLDLCPYPKKTVALSLVAAGSGTRRPPTGRQRPGVRHPSQG